MIITINIVFQIIRPFPVIKINSQIPQSSGVFREFLSFRTSLFLSCKLLILNRCGRNKM